jgi:hypothetical protein
MDLATLANQLQELKQEQSDGEAVLAALDGRRGMCLI